MAIAFYCEDEDPKMMYTGGSQGYYTAAYGYHQHNHHQQQSQHGVAVGPQQHHHAGSSGVTAAVDENNNNCALHSGNGGTGSGSDGGSSGKVQHDAASTVHSSKRQLMRVLHQVLYRYTKEGVLGPDHTSCLFCNRIYYLFQLLY